MFITISLLMAAACLLPAAGKLDADWDEIATRFSSWRPAPRSGMPEDVAAACLGLIDTPYSTGQILLIDGGMALR